MRRALLTAAAALVFLVLVGATYQGVATALERRQFPPPGRMVDVGDHQLHLHCVGGGSPTVVLEAPAAGMSAAWGWVQPAVAQVTRVCGYDRAGLGWSEAGDRPFDPSAVPEELQTLLERSREPGPYIVVGHGLGAAFATSFAARYGSEVGALVLVDPPPPAETSDHPEVRLLHASPWLARAGILRALRLLSGSAAGLPQASEGALAAFLNRPDHLTRAARELARWEDAVGTASAVALPTGLPVVRLQLAGEDRVAFLTDAEDAARVSAAVAALVQEFRTGQTR